MKRKFGALIIGILLLIIGGGYLGAAFGLWPMSIFFDGWWAVVIMIVGVYLMITSRPDWFNVALILVGLYLLAREQQWLTAVDDEKLFFGAALLYVGILFLIHFIRKPKAPGAPKAPGFTASGQPDFDDYPTYTAIMSGVEQQNASSHLKGAKLTAVMGGIDLDFRQAQVQEDITIYVTAIMGGANIYAPQNCKIAVRASNFLGGTDNHALSLPPDAIAPTVTFVCTAIMGGIDIY